MRGRLKNLIHDRRGATAIEYGLIVALIVIGIIGAMRSVGGGSGGVWSNLTSKVAAVETF